MHKLSSLDALRALAITLVVLFHSPVPAFQLDCGWIGVNLFFLLSGFLITKILLRIKENENDGIRGFYIRRISRVAPLYFLYLGAVFIVLFLSRNTSDQLIIQGWNDLANHWPYLLSFTYNFQEIASLMFSMDYTNSYFFGHLWSLSVEAQFYLVFPWFVMRLNRKQLLRLLIATIIAVPLMRVFFVTLATQQVTDLFWTGDVLYTATFFQLDTLALGALMAATPLNVSTRTVRRITTCLLIALAAIGSTHLFLSDLYETRMLPSTLGFDNPAYHTTTLSANTIFNHRYAYTMPLLNLFFASLLVLGLRYDGATIFQNRFLQGVARVSYGMYIYHLSISFVASYFVRQLLGKEPSDLSLIAQTIVQVFYLTILCVVSEMSYRYYEHFFLRGKISARIAVKQKKALRCKS